MSLIENKQVVLCLCLAWGNIGKGGIIVLGDGGGRVPLLPVLLGVCSALDMPGQERLRHVVAWRRCLRVLKACRVTNGFVFVHVADREQGRR